MASPPPRTVLPAFPFMLAALVLFMLGVYDVFIRPVHGPWVGRAEIAGAVAIFLLFVFWEIRLRAVVDLPEALRRVQDRYADLEAARKEHYRARTTLEGAIDRVEESRQVLAEFQSSFEKLVDKQHQLEDEMINRRQELGEAKRLAEDWQERAVHYIDSIERALSHEGLDKEYKSAMERSLSEYTRSLEALGFHVVQAQPGDAFDAKMHEVAGEEESQEQAQGTVLRCTRWGIMAGDKPLRMARVVVVKGAGDAEEEDEQDAEKEQE